MLHLCFRFNRKERNPDGYRERKVHKDFISLADLADNADFYCDENIYADFKIKSAQSVKSARENLKTKI